MRHPLIIVLLEQKREELQENEPEFCTRLFPKMNPAPALLLYRRIAAKQCDFPKRHIPSAAKILGVDKDALYYA